MLRDLSSLQFDDPLIVLLHVLRGCLQVRVLETIELTVPLLFTALEQ